MNIIVMNPRLEAGKDKTHGGTNGRTVEKLISEVAPGGDDLIVLPEHCTDERDQKLYHDYITGLAQSTGACVIGGSHHEQRPNGIVNGGIAVASTGHQAGAYSKLRPYSHELSFVTPGSEIGEFEIGGLRVMVLICADFWFSDLIQRAKLLPDILIVPALSVSRKKEPDYARTLWRNLAIARAYEFGIYVAISDWGEESVLPQYRTCGVGGFADPTTTDPNLFFQPVGPTGIQRFPVDLDALERFRDDRRQRGFFWK